VWVEEAVTVKKVVWTLLLWVLVGLILLSVTGDAVANERDDHVEIVRTGRRFHAWAEGYEITEYVPHPYYYCHCCPPPARVVPLPKDVRVLIAEREMLKVDFHYYSLSPYPGNQARAEWTASRLRDVESMIEAWRIGYR
jgi:hypothetical protein